MLNLKPTLRQREYLALQKKYQPYHLRKQPVQQRLDIAAENNSAGTDILLCVAAVTLGSLVGFLTPLLSDIILYFWL